MMKSIKVIGIGGIGTNLLFLLCRHLNSQGESRLFLVDGDEFESRNAIRQDFLKIGNKAKVKAEELANKFEDVSFRAIPDFVTEENIDSIVEEGDIVFMAVDNHATRKLISDHCQKLSNITLISGGNELTDGNVQTYIRCDGEDMTLPLTSFHPEIKNPTDKSPGEMSCEERAKQPGSRQILVANAGAAWLMYVAFWLYEEGEVDRIGEFYFDIMEETKVQNRQRKGKVHG